MRKAVSPLQKYGDFQEILGYFAHINKKFNYGWKY